MATPLPGFNPDTPGLGGIEDIGGICCGSGGCALSGSQGVSGAKPLRS